LIFFMALWDI